MQTANAAKDLKPFVARVTGIVNDETLVGHLLSVQLSIPARRQHGPVPMPGHCFGK
jgi:hypothetical protein